MSESDRNYYHRRAMEELAAASEATCVEAATAHKLLAEQFFALSGPAEDQTSLSRQSDCGLP